jgi:hypothetical protein
VTTRAGRKQQAEAYEAGNEDWHKGLTEADNPYSSPTLAVCWLQGRYERTSPAAYQRKAREAAATATQASNSNKIGTTEMYDDTQRVSILLALDELRAAVAPAPISETELKTPKRRGRPRKAPQASSTAEPLRQPPGPIVRLCMAIEALSKAQTSALKHQRHGKHRDMHQTLVQIKAAARHVALSLKATAAGA